MARRQGRVLGGGSVGGLGGKRAQGSIEGFEELVKNVRRMSDQARVQLLNNAVNQGTEETRDIMQQLAPRNPDGPTRARFGHGADNIVIASPRRRPGRDKRARVVGPSWRTGRHMIFAEFGTTWHPEDPFVRPTFRAMKKRMIKIIELHYRKMTRSIRGSF